MSRFVINEAENPIGPLTRKIWNGDILSHSKKITYVYCSRKADPELMTHQSAAHFWEQSPFREHFFQGKWTPVYDKLELKVIHIDSNRAFNQTHIIGWVFCN